jgi:Tol biopolymer transport system component
VHELENRPMKRVRPRRSYPPWIAIAVAMAMLAAGCGSSSEAGPTEPTSRVDAGKATPTRVPSAARLGSLAYGVDGDIYVAEWDGSNPVRIADGRPANECVLAWPGEYWGEGPIWSPDGRYLAYRHTSCDGPEDAWRHVVISDPQGNVIAEFPGDGWSISWSPDSTRVAVWVDFFETIGVFGVDGERQALLTVPPEMLSGGDHDPVWLPDGESLVLKGVVVPIDGSTPYHRPLSGGTFSHDGSRVAKATRKSLVIAEADGSNPQVVFDGWVSEPVWSPTGDRIAFTEWKRGSGGVNQLRVLDVATGAVTLLAEADGSDMLEVIDFSPERDRIFFSRTKDGQIGVGSLWSVKADGSDLRRLVAMTAWGDWLSRGPTP